MGKALTSLFLLSLICSVLAMSRKILVTGGNQGIGKAICQKILTDFPDCHVFLGSRDAAKGEAAVSSIVKAAGSERIQCVSLDVTDAASVQALCAQLLAAHGEGSFYGLVNNAGVGFGRSLAETLAVNLYGPKRVTEAMLPLLGRPGRIVNLASASGPMYVAKLSADRKKTFADATSWEQLQAVVETLGVAQGDEYGFSKACLNSYTMQLAAQQPDLVVNSCTPGFIATQLTEGMGATGTPEQGTRCPLHCLFAPAEEVGTGRYYGSDSVRSPLDRYRGPGDPPYNP
ncbi:hypothetical protein B484DRAFT_324312 [Ochromonadaceae sp. CCMP2298]|nr:hypothetical protein B484DRAFT_324312 [Ochromonadaceae sp. CCMP2298]